MSLFTYIIRLFCEAAENSDLLKHNMDREVLVRTTHLKGLLIGKTLEFYQHDLYRKVTDDVHLQGYNYKRHDLSVLVTETVGKTNNLGLCELEG